MGLLVKLVLQPEFHLSRPVVSHYIFSLCIGIHASKGASELPTFCGALRSHCLYFYVESDHVDCLNVFHKAGQVVNCCDEHGTTPLHVAAKKGSPVCIEFLVERAGSDISTRFDKYLDFSSQTTILVKLNGNPSEPLLNQ